MPRSRVSASCHQEQQTLHESDLLKAMRQVAETGSGPKDQTPSAGCGIKWKYD